MSGLARLGESLDPAALLWLGATLLAYAVAVWLNRRSGGHPLVNPVIIATALVIAAVIATETTYDAYFQGAYAIHFLLGPATVALAVPLYRHLDAIRRHAKAMLIAVLCGSLTAAGGAVVFGLLFGARDDILLALSTKSITTPIAIGVAEAVGGSAPLAVAFVILTGMTTIFYGPQLLDRLGLRDPAAQGLALGVVAHGIGTGRAFQIDPVAGTFAGLAMGLNGVASAFLLPLLHAMFML